MSLIGKRYEGGYWFVDRAEWKKYAAAVDDLHVSEQEAPPMYHVRAFIGLMVTLASDPELSLDLLRLVHAGHRMRFYRSLHHGDLLHVRAILENIDHKNNGTLVVFRLLGYVDGEVAMEGETSYFVRKSSLEEKKPIHINERTFLNTRKQKVSLDQSLRYAEASGDNNPLHTDVEVAKMAGLPNVILHGLCTLAFAVRDLHAEIGNGRSLSYIQARFSAPVFPGETLQLFWENDDQKVLFETRNMLGKAVLTAGVAEFE